MNPAIEKIRAKKLRNEKIAVLTAYDYPLARLLDESGVDIILVGDSLGMVVLGLPDTVGVTMRDMTHHCRAVARGVEKSLIVCDLPFASYETPAQAVMNAQTLMEAGAHAVKLEGGVAKREEIAAIVRAKIPVMAHIGMLPQHVREEGGYKIKGKTPEQAEQVLADARAAEEAGAFAVVMELVKPEIAAQITEAVSIPTIGIGSGAACDGQVLVVHDLVGFFPWFTPKFAKPKAQVGEQIKIAVSEFIRETRGEV